MKDDREHLILMTGVIIGAVACGVLSDMITFPWWLSLPLSLAGIWVIFDVARGWVRERARTRTREQKEWEI